MTDVTALHPSALSAVASAKHDMSLASEDDHRLMLCYVMGACHSISVLDQADDATALVLRINSEIIVDPSLPEQRPPESVALLEEQGLLLPPIFEQLVIDADTEETILVKVDPDDEGPPVGSLTFGEHSLTSHDASQPLLDLPTANAQDGEVTGERVQHLVGDSLEITMLQTAGWRYATRPSAPPNLSEALLMSSHNRRGGGQLFVDGAFNDFDIFRHPELPSYVDTVMLPPPDAGHRTQASALAILRRFDFDSDLRRMGSIVRTLPNVEEGGWGHGREEEGGRHFLLVKGAPESIREICIPASLPADFEPTLQQLTLAGYRVLACGTRSLEHLGESSMMKAGREELEQDLTFAGLLVMENSLKEETTGFLREYSRAGFRQLMVTGTPAAPLSPSRTIEALEGGFSQSLLPLFQSLSLC